MAGRFDGALRIAVETLTLARLCGRGKDHLFILRLEVRDCPEAYPNS
jgi:hypothetical protein